MSKSCNLSNVTRHWHHTTTHKQLKLCLPMTQLKSKRYDRHPIKKVFVEVNKESRLPYHYQLPFKPEKQFVIPVIMWGIELVTITMCHIRTLLGTIWERLRKPLTHLVRISKKLAVSTMCAVPTVN